MNNFFNKRTIEFVLNKDDGSTLYADSFFLKEENEVFNYRSELQKAIKGIREPLFVCYYCGQNIKINGGGQTMKVLYFAHRKDSDFCQLKTDTDYSPLEIKRLKYNGAKESPQIQLLQQLEEEDKSTFFKIIDKMLTTKKFKDFFNKNVAMLLNEKTSQIARFYLLKIQINP